LTQDVFGDIALVRNRRCARRGALSESPSFERQFDTCSTRGWSFRRPRLAFRGALGWIYMAVVIGRASTGSLRGGSTLIARRAE